MDASARSGRTRSVASLIRHFFSRNSRARLRGRLTGCCFIGWRTGREQRCDHENQHCARCKAFPHRDEPNFAYLWCNPRCSIDFVVTNAGKPISNLFGLASFRTNFANNCGCKRSGNSPAGLFLSRHSAAGVGRREVIYPAVKNRRSAIKKFCVYSEARV